MHVIFFCTAVVHLTQRNQPLAGRLFACNRNIRFQITAAYRKERSVIFQRIINLIPCKADCRDNVSRRMRFREHVLDFQAGINVPLRYTMVPHILLHFLGQQFGCFTLTGDLHDFKCKLGFQSLVQQIGHDRVTAADNLRNGTGAVFNQLLRVTQPDVGSVGQTRYLQQVGELGRMALHQHSTDKRCAHLRQRKGSGFRKDLFRRYTERLGRIKERVNLRVAHRNLHDLDAGVVLNMFIQGRNFVSQLIQLQDGVVQ